MLQSMKPFCQTFYEMTSALQGSVAKKTACSFGWWLMAGAGLF
jgi:hypothetical protein